VQRRERTLIPVPAILAVVEVGVEVEVVKAMCRVVNGVEVGVEVEAD
jgi:hypothetical protein